MNAVRKDWDRVEVRFVLAYPDLYEVGMAHLGTHILYHVINEHPACLAERVFSPAQDMEGILRDEKVPLFSLESRRPVGDFDFVGITLQYEMTYTNVLNMLSMASIPIRAEQRGEEDPLVIGGGPCAFNAEPVAPFFDLIVLGDGEEAVVELIDEYRSWKLDGSPGGRRGFLGRAAATRGMYVPALYDAVYDEEGCFSGVTPRGEAPRRVTKRIVSDLDQAPFPERPVVPYAEVVHDRAVVEIFRGCTRGCRFCMPGTVYRPVRERDPDDVVKLCCDIVGNTGYPEVSLASLSSTDYSCIEEVTDRLTDRLSESRVSVALPSLRVDEFSVRLARKLQEVRHTGITLAPEAGTQRLRDVINKRVTEEDYISSLRAAFASGCDTVKLYFMIGLPTETAEDVRGIAALVKRAGETYDEFRESARPLRVNVSVACFIPKPHTPFQWEEQLSLQEFETRLDLLRRELPRRGVKFSWHDPQMSIIEGVLSRGDRRVADAVQAAWENGCRFDGWSEHFRAEDWHTAFYQSGVQTQRYTLQRSPGRPLPWDHLDAGVSEAFLLRERRLAYAERSTGDCRWEECSGCGVCSSGGVSCRVSSDGRDERG